MFILVIRVRSACIVYVSLQSYILASVCVFVCMQLQLLHLSPQLSDIELHKLLFNSRNYYILLFLILSSSIVMTMSKLYSVVMIITLCCVVTKTEIILSMQM